MDLRNKVKRGLRMCGHAVVSTIHDRLNGIDRILQDLLDQNTHLAATQTPLLQTGVHLVESMAALHEEIRQAESRIQASLVELRRHSATKADLRDELGGVTAGLADFRGLLENIVALGRDLRSASQAEMAALEKLDTRIDQTLSSNSTALAAGLAEMRALGDRIAQATATSLAVLEPVAYQTRAFLENETARQISVETSNYRSINPELGLLEFLYSWLPSRKALDIGAHIGDVSEHLLRVGYDVYAFEPYPESFLRLQQRLGGVAAFHPMNAALGSADGEMPLHLVTDRSPDNRYEDATVFHSLTKHGMPDDLVFQGAVMVRVYKLADLHRSGLVPEDIGIVKIDTEGFDLEVIRGMDDFRYPIVMVEFWDALIPLGTQGLYTLSTMVAAMRERGYFWYIVIYRVWGKPRTAFFCNHDQSVPESWGNVIFFRDHAIFVEAQRWCAAVLPRTYFKNVPAAAGRAQLEA